MSTYINRYKQYQKYNDDYDYDALLKWILQLHKGTKTV